MKTLHKWLSLNRRQRALYTRAAAWTALVRIGLLLFHFRRLRRLLAGYRSCRRTRLRSPGIYTPEEMARAVVAAGRRIPGGDVCLVQALAMKSLMDLEGHPARLLIGVLRPDRLPLEAHAWVEYKGRVVIGGPESERFVRLAVLD